MTRVAKTRSATRESVNRSGVERFQSLTVERGRDAIQEILTLQAEGSYDKAKALLDKYAVIRPPMQRALDKLKDVPVDIEPVFPLGK